MTTAKLHVGEPDDPGFTMEDFQAQLTQRWPAARLIPDPVSPGWQWVLGMPHTPLLATLDPVAIGGIRWWPKLRTARDPSVAHGWRWLPELNPHPPECAVAPTLGIIRFDQLEVADLAVCAHWLRGWLPPRVPIVAGTEEMYRTIPILPTSTITAIVHAFLETCAGAPTDPPYPLTLAQDVAKGELEKFVARLLYEGGVLVI